MVVSLSSWGVAHRKTNVCRCTRERPQTRCGFSAGSVFERERLDLGQLDGEGAPEHAAVGRDVQAVARRVDDQVGVVLGDRDGVPGRSPPPVSRQVMPASWETTSGGLRSTTATIVEPAAAAATTRGRESSAARGRNVDALAGSISSVRGRPRTRRMSVCATAFIAAQLHDRRRPASRRGRRMAGRARDDVRGRERVACAGRVALERRALRASRGRRVHDRAPRPERDDELGHVDVADELGLLLGKRRRRSRYIAIVYVLLHTGIRVSELCNLNRSNIDFIKNELIVERNEEERRIPLTYDTRVHLEDYLRSIHQMRCSLRKQGIV